MESMYFSGQEITRMRIDNWAIGFKMPYKIKKINNAVLQSEKTEKYIIKNNGKNQDIASKGSIRISFEINTHKKIELPQRIELLCFENVVPTDNVKVTYKVKKGTNNSLDGEITIVNTSNNSIKDWRMGFESTEKITCFKNASQIKIIIKSQNSGKKAVLSNFQVYEISNKKDEEEVDLQPLDCEKERIEKIELMYEKNLDLKEKYQQTKKQNILTQIEQNKRQMKSLGVAVFEANEQRCKSPIMKTILVGQKLPESNRYSNYSSYRYKTVIRGRLYEMQVITEEPTGVLRGPLVNKVTIMESYTKSYGTGIKAGAITALKIALSDVVGKIPGGTVMKNLYDICKSGSDAMTTSTIIRGTNTDCTTVSQNTIRTGYLKRYGKKDSYQEKVYVGNRVEMLYAINMYYSRKMKIGQKTYRSASDRKYTLQSRSFNSISLKVIQSPTSNKHRVFTKDETIYRVPYKFMGKSFSHKICSVYTGSMMEFHDF